MAWIAGPPMFSREITRTRRTAVTSRSGGELVRAQAVLQVLDRPAQPLAQVDARRVAEVAARGGQVGQRVAHVAGARRRVEGLDVAVDELAQHADELVERHA